MCRASLHRFARPGDYVRFAPLANCENCKPSPVRVQSVTLNGMLKFEGREGVYAPQLFVVVEEKQEGA